MHSQRMPHLPIDADPQLITQLSILRITHPFQSLSLVPVQVDALCKAHRLQSLWQIR